jgi:hypothetical protein
VEAANFTHFCREGKETKEAFSPTDVSSGPQTQWVKEMNKCRPTIPIIILFSHPTRRKKYEIPVITNENTLHLKSVSAYFLSMDQITRTYCIICVGWCFIILYLKPSLFEIIIFFKSDFSQYAFTGLK